MGNFNLLMLLEIILLFYYYYYHHHYSLDLFFVNHGVALLWPALTFLSIKMELSFSHGFPPLFPSSVSRSAFSWSF